jgi:hypothetical protein
MTLENKPCDISTTTKEDSLEDSKPPFGVSSNTSIMFESTSIIQDVVRSELQKEGHLVNIVVSSIQSILEFNTKLLELRFKDIDQRFLKVEEHLKEMKNIHLTMTNEPNFGTVNDRSIPLEDNIKECPYQGQNTSNLLESQIQQAISPKFHEINQRFAKMEEHHRNELEVKLSSMDPRFVAIDQRALSLEKSILTLEKTVESKLKQEAKETKKVPLLLVPGFEGAEFTWSYQSSRGNFLTAHCFSGVGSVDGIGAFQEWTAVPTGLTSWVYLRNSHGTFLRTNGYGTVDSAVTPNTYERWTIEKYQDGTVALCSYFGSYLSDKPNTGLCATKELGWHKWRLKN